MRGIVQPEAAQGSNAVFDFRLNVVFNWVMDSAQHPDWERITELGGPIKVASRLGWTKPGSVQRVQNWKKRGIPAQVKLEHPFLRRKPAKVD